jgi:hypothetical protein
MLALTRPLAHPGRSPEPARLCTAARLATSPAPDRLKQLQLRLLEQETGLEARLTPYIPLLSVAVAVLGASLGAYRYLRDRRGDFALRVEQEVAVNLGSLVDYPQPASRLSGRVATALDNLNWLVDRTDDPPRYRQRVTEAILVEVRDDIDFDDEKQARFDAMCLARWPSYSAYLRTQASLHDYILYRYTQALRSLHDQDPGYFEAIQRIDGSYQVSRYAREALYRHFQVLVDGFSAQLGLIDDPARRARQVEEFADALHNRELASQLFGSGASGD